MSLRQFIAMIVRLQKSCKVYLWQAEDYLSFFMLISERRGTHLMKRVLIVDDAVFMRVSLKSMLEKNGYEVVGEADNGAEGVKKYVEIHPDLVTLDITMPGMNGIEALKKIKGYDPDAKVIMASALGQESYIKEAISSGAGYFIVKPFKEEHVIETLKKIL